MDSRLAQGAEIGIVFMGAPKGTKHSDETRRKMSLAHLGKKRAPFSQECRQKMSDAKKGKKPNNYGKPQSEKTRRRKSESLRGNKSVLWVHGNGSANKTERQKAMQNVEYKIWRATVFERDKFTCVICGKSGVKLNADHIKSWAKYPSLRYSVDNGRTLCLPCHKTTETYGNPKKEQK